MFIKLLEYNCCAKQSRAGSSGLMWCVVWANSQLSDAATKLFVFPLRKDLLSIEHHHTNTTYCQNPVGNWILLQQLYLFPSSPVPSQIP